MAFEIDDTAPPGRESAHAVRSRCLECDGELTVLRVIGGRAGCEYWTMRCADCGGIHLDILEPDESADDHGGPLSAA